MRHVPTILAFASWGWTSALPNSMVRSIMGRGKPAEEDGWLSWRTRSLREARRWVIGQVGCTFDEWLLRAGMAKWEEWLRRHERSCIRRLIGWQSAALRLGCGSCAAQRSENGQKTQGVRRQNAAEVGGPKGGRLRDALDVQNPKASHRVVGGCGSRTATGAARR